MTPQGPGDRASWAGVRVVVAGFGAAGFAAADNLTHLGARVVALDESDAGDRREKAELLGVLGAEVRLGPGTTADLPAEAELLVVSPGWDPTNRSWPRPATGPSRSSARSSSPGGCVTRPTARRGCA